MTATTAPHKGSLLSAMFLIAGCCIGGGMLALPVASGASGFLPSLAMMGLCWAAMTLSALLLVEVSLWMTGEAHIITMTSKLLGKPARILSWILFLYISYASEVAYAAGGGAQISHIAEHLFGITISKEIAAIVLTLGLTSALLLGAQLVGRVNAVFFIGLVLAYFMLVGMGSSEVKFEHLMRAEWAGSYKALPLILTAFSFQTMVPSLTPILKRHTSSLRTAIIGGTTIPFVVYALWQFIILGIVPAEGPHGLIEANIQSVPATVFLYQHVENHWIIPVAEYFGFFAIVTSFLAIGLGLFDFLADGLKIEKKGWGNIGLALLIIVPTIICATFFERAFMVAMDTSGGFGDTILNGMIPVAMVWTGRYVLNYKNDFRLPGGKPMLCAIFSFFFIALLLEILMVTGTLPSSSEPSQAYKLEDAQILDIKEL